MSRKINAFMDICDLPRTITLLDQSKTQTHTQEDGNEFTQVETVLFTGFKDDRGTDVQEHPNNHSQEHVDVVKLCAELKEVSCEHS